MGTSPAFSFHPGSGECKLNTCSAVTPVAVGVGVGVNVGVGTGVGVAVGLGVVVEVWAEAVVGVEFGSAVSGADVAAVGAGEKLGTDVGGES